MEDMEEYLSLSQAARLVNVAPETLNKASNNGEVAVHHTKRKAGHNCKFFEAEEVYKWNSFRLEEQKGEKIIVRMGMVYEAVKQIPELRFPGPDGMMTWQNLGFSGRHIHLFNGVRSEYVSPSQAFAHNRGEFMKIFRGWGMEGMESNG